MGNLSLPDISKKLADIDFTMLMTRTENGEIAGRPMSNNGDVDYDGDSYYFTWERSRMVSDIRREPKVSLAFQGSKSLLGKPPIMIAVEGKAELITDKNQFEAHWNAELDRWFEQGAETPGVVMIKVRATRIHYWDGEDDGKILV
jgi:general stress protein 26